MGMHAMAVHFISIVEQVRNTDDLAAAMAAITAKLGFHYFAVTHHIDIVAASGTAIRVHDYGFGSFDALEEVILAGLQAGAFDRPPRRKVLQEINASVAKDDVREAIAKPWAIFREGLGDDGDEFLDALAASIERHHRSKHRTPAIR